MPAMRSILLVSATALVLFAPSVARSVQAATIDAVRERGHLVCGVSEGHAGFSQADAKGNWSGLDVDFCRAVAAAVLGRGAAVKYRPLSLGDRFTALKRGDVDILARGTAWTLSRDTEFGARFAGILYYDGQGFMVRAGDAVASVLELSGASICVLAGTQAEHAARRYFGRLGMGFDLVSSEHWEELVRLYSDGKCTVLTGDMSALGLERSRLARPSEHLLLPELISKEPLGPAVRAGDEQWFSIVRWTLMALIEAEELGITSGNAEAMRGSKLVETRRFTGVEGSLGVPLGLGPGWAYEIVRQAGNYAEIFERNLGARSPLKMRRGLNALWADGGLMYSAPFR